MIRQSPLIRRTLPAFLALSVASLTALGTAWAQVVRRPDIPPIGVSQQPQPRPQGTIMMRIEEDQVTAEIRNMPLRKVLEEIAARTGVIFEVSSELNPEVSVSLFRVSLKEAIERIVAVGDSILYYQRDAVGQARVSLVRVFPRGMKGKQGGLVYIGTGVLTKTGRDAIETPEQALGALAENQDVEAREKAVEVLVAAKGEVAVQGLTKALNDPAIEVLVAAIEGLTRLGARSALPQILSALKHSHPGVRQSCVEAVALLGSSQNVKDLRPLVQDKDAAVAAAADLAIRKLSSESVRLP